MVANILLPPRLFALLQIPIWKADSVSMDNVGRERALFPKQAGEYVGHIKATLLAPQET